MLLNDTNKLLLGIACAISVTAPGITLLNTVHAAEQQEQRNEFRHNANTRQDGQRRNRRDRRKKNNDNDGDEPLDQALVDLGDLIFHDANLSNPPGQSCASCHTSSAGFADPDNTLATSEGAVLGRFGSRNAPTNAYAAFIPPFQNSNNPNNVIGGLFWDGRADDLEEQARAPFTNPLEMNMPDEAAVVAAVSQATYAAEFLAIFGANAFDDVDTAFDQIAEAVAAYGIGDEDLNQFSSKFDAVMAGTATFSDSEANGFQLFVSNNNGGANCARCHSINGNPILFTDFEYDNTGVPANPLSPFFTNSVEFNPDGANFVDLGLGGVTGDPDHDGRFRVPTLRNVALSSPYMHNGVFATLAEVMEFYNSRNAADAEVTDNVTNNGVGNLNLNAQEQQDIINFLETLTDGFDPNNPDAPAVP